MHMNAVTLRHSGQREQMLFRYGFWTEKKLNCRQPEVGAAEEMASS
jgi:hypothetical protein